MQVVLWKQYINQNTGWLWICQKVNKVEAEIWKYDIWNIFINYTW